MKLHFYKLGVKPDLPGLMYSDYTGGLWGFAAPQALTHSLGYKTVAEFESEERDRVRNGNRQRRRVKTY